MKFRNVKQRDSFTKEIGKTVGLTLIVGTVITAIVSTM